MYSVVAGIVHPPLGKELNFESYEFFDISESESGTHIFSNLMKEVLDNNKPNNIVQIFEDFFKSRAIELNDINKHYQNILNAFIEYHKWYSGNKSSAVNFYLVKRDLNENKVVDVIKTWKVYRETKTYYKSRNKKKKV